MDALVPAFLLALLLEPGDRFQMRVMALAGRFRAPGAVIGGVALAALVNMALAGLAGVEIGALIPHQAARLLTGVALMMAGGAALFRPKPPSGVEGWRLGAFASSAGASLVLALGDKTQFLVAAIAAGSGEPWLAAAGGTAGVVAASLPAALLGARWAEVAPWRLVRIGAGGVVVLAGAVLAVLALGIG